MNINKFYPVILRGMGQLILICSLLYISRKDTTTYEKLEFYLKSIDTILPLMIFGNLSLSYYNLRNREKNTRFQVISSVILGLISILVYGFLYNLTSNEKIFFLLTVIITSYIKISCAEIIFHGKTFKAFFLDFFLFQLLLGILLFFNFPSILSILVSRLIPLLILSLGPKLSVFQFRRSSIKENYTKLKSQFSYLITDFTNQLMLNLDILILSFYSVKFAAYAIILRLLMPINLLTQYSNASFHNKLRTQSFWESLLNYKKEAYSYLILILIYSTCLIVYQKEILSFFNLTITLDTVVLVFISLGKIINFITAGVGVFLVHKGLDKVLKYSSLLAITIYFSTFIFTKELTENIIYSVALSTFLSTLIINSLKLFYVIKND